MREIVKPPKRKSGKYSNIVALIATFLFLCGIIALSYIAKIDITDKKILLPLGFVGILFILSIFQTLKDVDKYNKELTLVYNPSSGEVKNATFIRAISKGKVTFKHEGRQMYCKFYAIQFKYVNNWGNEKTAISKIYYDHQEMLYLQSLHEFKVAEKFKTVGIVEDVSKAYELNMDELNAQMKENATKFQDGVCPQPPVFDNDDKLVGFRNSVGILKDIIIDSTSKHKLAVIASKNNPEKTINAKIKFPEWANYLHTMIGKDIPILVSERKIYIDYDAIYKGSQTDTTNF